MMRTEWMPEQISPTEPKPIVLPPYERWMVSSNIRTIIETDATVASQTALLRANGYVRVADAIASLRGERVFGAILV